MSTKRVVLILVLALGVGSVCSISAQDEDESKAIKAAIFIKKRPAKPATTKPPSSGRYRPAVKSKTTAIITPPTGKTFAELGLTFWRFRKSTVADKTKELVEDDDTPTEWTLERIEDGTPLTPGQKVRFSVESLSRDGYLYVINREQYADGALGDPVLVFPNKNSAGANQVQAGRLIYIPSATGKFTIKPSDNPKLHVGEAVTILVSAKPLIADERLVSRSLKLSREQVEGWEKQWTASSTKFELVGGNGQAMTQKEQTAATDMAEFLTQDDPVPQTVYRLVIRPEDPLILTVFLKFSKSE